MTLKSVSNRPVAFLATISLAVAGVFGLGAASHAVSAGSPTIIFSGNTLATSLPATETADRISGTTSLSTLSLSRVVTTTRAGYTFGGWSLTAGGPVTTEITTPTTSDTTRTIHAVWNTSITFNVNGADSGTPAGGVTSSTYRFGQTLTLPAVGSMVKSGYSFGGWMSSSTSTTRATSYLADTAAVGNPTLFAAWIKTVAFNGNGGTAGTIPSQMTYLAGSTALKLPVLSEMTLRRPGYEFLGWATTATGTPLSNPGSYTPIFAQSTLYAIWKIQPTKASSRVFFRPGKSGLRASQKLELRDLIDTLRGKTAIQITVRSNRSRLAARSLGGARNNAVVEYLESLGVVATFIESNRLGTGRLATTKKNNRVTVSANWTNP